MTKPLSCMEAIREYDPEGKPSPFLAEFIERIAKEAHHHFEEWDDSDFFNLVEGLDALITAAQTQDSAIETPPSEDDYITAPDFTLLGFEGAAIGGMYRRFVCSRVAGAELADALMAHALATAAQANVRAHQIDKLEAPGHEDYEQIAGWAMTAQELLGKAKLSRQGVLYAEWKASNQGRPGAEKRHERLREIKDGFLDFYRADQFKTKSDAARRYYRSLPPEDQRTLAPTGKEEGAVRTLVSHLRQSSQ